MITLNHNNYNTYQSNQHPVQPAQNIRTVIGLCSVCRYSCHQHCRSFLVKAGCDMLGIDGCIHPTSLKKINHLILNHFKLPLKKINHLILNHIKLSFFFSKLQRDGTLKSNLGASSVSAFTSYFIKICSEELIIFYVSPF